MQWLRETEMMYESQEERRKHRKTCILTGIIAWQSGVRCFVCEDARSPPEISLHEFVQLRHHQGQEGEQGLLGRDLESHRLSNHRPQPRLSAP